MTYTFEPGDVVVAIRGTQPPLFGNAIITFDDPDRAVGNEYLVQDVCYCPRCGEQYIIWDEPRPAFIVHKGMTYRFDNKLPLYCDRCIDCPMIHTPNKGAWSGHFRKKSDLEAEITIAVEEERYEDAGVLTKVIEPEKIST